MTMLRILSAAVAVAAVFAAVPASAEMKTEWVEYSQGGMKLKAYMAYDDKITGKRPAVFVVHAREGMTPKTQQLTELWAKLGYVSFAADIFGYGSGVLPKDVPEMTAQTQIFRKDPALTKARTQAGYDTLIKNPMVDTSKVALIGYCWLGQQRQGQVSDPAWRRGSGLSAHQGQHGRRRPARRQGPLPARSLQRHWPRLLQSERQGRGARQCPVDRVHLAHHEGTVRYLMRPDQARRRAAKRMGWVGLFAKPTFCVSSHA